MRARLAPIAAVWLACAGGGARARAPREAEERAALLAATLAEGMSCVAAAAADGPLLRTRGEHARRAWARTGVAALRDFCAATVDAAGAPTDPFCVRHGPGLDAVERATSGMPEEVRAAARDLVGAWLADLGLPAGVTVDRFLTVSASLLFLEQIASDAGWRELREEPGPALAEALRHAAGALDEACSAPASAPPGWDCARARPHLDALRRVAGEASPDERVREPARALVELLRFDPAGGAPGAALQAGK